MSTDRPTPSSPVTSTDVARLAGVSRATVSFVLNDTQGQRVSAATRERVRAAAKQLGYVPHAAARALRAGRSDLVLLPASASALGRLVSDWVDQLHSELAGHGYTVVLHAGRFADPVAGARAWAELRPAAVLALDGERFTEPAAELLRSAGIHALVSVSARPIPGVHHLAFDHADIGAIAVRHLVSRGRQRIGVVMPQERGLNAFAEPRLGGAQGVAASCTATVVPLELSYSLESAAALVERWPDLGLDALFAYNDEYAALLVHAFQDAGVSIPGEVAVVGADDLLQARLQRPQLTSIRLDFPTAAQVAGTIHRLIETGSSPQLPPVAYTLIHRQSS